MVFLVGTLAGMVIVMIHYEALNFLSEYIGSKKRHRRHSMLLAVAGVVSAHLLECLVFAAVYWVRDSVMALDTFNLKREMNFFDYFSFSVENYTSLGYGDIYLLGSARFLSSIEVLIGLILLGWTSSFFFLMMSRYWQERIKDLPKN